MTPNRFRILVAVLMGSLMRVGPGQACTCSAPTSAAEAWEKSSAVFRGRVTAISRPFLDSVGLTRSGNHRVRFEIIDRWKGPKARSRVVTTRLSGEGCGFPFEARKEYLVYVAPGPMGIETGICTGTKNAADAEREMEQLDQLRRNRR